MTISQTKLWMTFCCGHMMHYHMVLAVVISKKLEQGYCLLVMCMKQTINRADVFTTSLMLVLKKEVFIRANSFRTCLWISFAFLWYYLQLKKIRFCWKSKLPEVFCLWVNCSALFHCLAKSNETSFSFKLFYCYLDLWEGY